MPWKTLARLRLTLEGANLPFRVDGLDWHALAPEFRAEIEAGYEVLLGVGTEQPPLTTQRSAQEEAQTP